MISKQEQKYVTSLHLKKYRTETGDFIVEGEKNILELLNSDFEIKRIYSTENFRTKLEKLHKSIEINSDTEGKISSISTFKANNAGVAIVKQKQFENFKIPIKGQFLFLDGIADPGNLGTIIRIADWYGIGTIFASTDTTEFYNPKVIAATMGSFIRVKIIYTDILKLIQELEIPVFGAFLNGVDHKSVKTQEDFALVIGSESHGIKPELEKIIKTKITIGRKGQAESLNASVATGILLDHLIH